MTRRIAQLLLVTLALLILPQCGPLTDVCQKALPVLSTANSYATNGELALDNAKRFIDSSTLSAADKAKADMYINTAYDQLQKAAKVVADAGDLCNSGGQISLPVVFKAFLDTWDLISPLIQKAMPTGASPQSTLAFAPAVWVQYRGPAAAK